MTTDTMKKGQLVRVNSQVYGTSKQNSVGQHGRLHTLIRNTLDVWLVDLVDGDNEAFYAHELDVVNKENK